MEAITLGNIVTAKYKTGRYIGEVIKIEPARILVKILAVLKHPTQGDLHSPKQTNVALFHTRKALAHFEKAWMPEATVELYEKEIPSYTDSLKNALEVMEGELSQRDSDFAKKSLDCLNELKNVYQLS
jgi:kinase-associated protein B